MVCLILAAVQGFIPIFIIAGGAFAGLAWLCAVKWPLSSVPHSVVLVVSLLLAALVGVVLDRDTFGPRYRYLSQGGAQLRVDEKAGRTDRLYTGGWVPIAYDRAPQELDKLPLVFTVNMSDGVWGSPSGRICFTVDNKSEYVLNTIDIEASIGAKDENGFSKIDPTKTATVKLRSEYGGLLSPGENTRMCGPAPRELSADETWSFTLQHYYGWKK